MENKIQKIVKEAADEETEVTLRKILYFAKNNPSYRVFILATGQSKNFFKSIEREKTQFKIQKYRNLTTGISGFLSLLIPSFMGIIEVLRPIDLHGAEELFYDCGPSTVTMILMENNQYINELINKFSIRFDYDELEECILKDEKAMVFTVGIGDIPPDKNYQELIAREKTLILFQ